MKLWNKIKEALDSFRFWYAVVIALAFYLDEAGIIPGALAKTLELFAGTGITVRTLDNLFKKK